jgi:hypothetical protein
MMRHWRRVAALCAGLLLGIALDGYGTARRTEAKDSTPRDAEIASLKAEIQAIKDRLPDQAHAMQDVANQFTNVWFAREQANWELAELLVGRNPQPSALGRAYHSQAQRQQRERRRLSCHLAGVRERPFEAIGRGDQSAEQQAFPRGL